MEVYYLRRKKQGKGQTQAESVHAGLRLRWPSNSGCCAGLMPEKVEERKVKIETEGGAGCVTEAHTGVLLVTVSH